MAGNIIQVFVLYNPEEFDSEDLRTDLAEDKLYDSSQRIYIFFNEHTEFPTEVLLDSDEIWVFGNCKKTMLYEIAQANALDIWIMG